MNGDLETCLQQCGVKCHVVVKAEKVRLLSRWTTDFAELLKAARHGEIASNVLQDRAADAEYFKLGKQEFYVLPDDPSGMPSFLCRADSLPDFHKLVTDEFTRCDEIVVIGGNFTWSSVWVNHGAPQLVARYFLAKNND